MVGWQMVIFLTIMLILALPVFFLLVAYLGSKAIQRDIRFGFESPTESEKDSQKQESTFREELLRRLQTLIKD